MKPLFKIYEEGKKEFENCEYICACSEPKKCPRMQDVTLKFKNITLSLLDSLIERCEEMMFQIRETGTGETFKAHKALSEFKDYLISEKKKIV